jgi:hypothetical protein
VVSRFRAHHDAIPSGVRSPIVIRRTRRQRIRETSALYTCLLRGRSTTWRDHEDWQVTGVANPLSLEGRLVIWTADFITSSLALLGSRPIIVADAEEQCAPSLQLVLFHGRTEDR